MQKDLGKQQALNGDPKAIQQINFTGNIIGKNNQDQNVNDNRLTFSTMNCRSIVNLFYFDIISV